MTLPCAATGCIQKIGLIIVALSFLHTVAEARTESYSLHDTGEQTSDSRSIYIRGVGAADFDPENWTTAPPHLVADVRHPLLEPGAGSFRNIYAPSAVARPGGGWDVYFGGWDGIPEGRDAISMTTTDDFTSFGARKTVVEPGPFQHVCNVNAQFAAAGGSSVTMMCTVYPDSNGRNKPGLFHLSQPFTQRPVIASSADIVQVVGYKGYANADINGMNVLLQDNDRSLLYFGDFQNFGKVYVATGDAASTSTFELKGAALDEPLAVNDVKILRDARDQRWYLMGLHMNRGQLYYSLSRDPLVFPPATELLRSATDADKHIVAIGWVTDGDTSRGGDRVLGVLYGAGKSPALDTNRIFARWIQKRLDFQSSEGEGDNAAPEVRGALGPDTVVLSVRSKTWNGELKITNEGGKREGKIKPVTLLAGHVYELRSISGQ